MQLSDMFNAVLGQRDAGVVICARSLSLAPLLAHPLDDRNLGETANLRHGLRLTGFAAPETLHVRRYVREGRRTLRKQM